MIVIRRNTRYERLCLGNNNTCTKRAIRPTDFCVAHGGGLRCKYEGCNKSAISPTDFCVGHGGGKRCQYEGCSNSARKRNDFCIAHGGGKRCQYEGCSKSATSPTDFCITHGGGLRCQYEGCTKSAISPTDFCRRHGGGSRCSGCGLVSVEKKGQKCSQCRGSSPRQKKFELMVETYLKQNDNLQHYSYRDEPLPCSPTQRRPDFTYLLHTHVVILEVDEYAHKFYNRDCECVRILELSEQARGLPIVVIRFNPKKKLLNDLKTILETAIKNQPNKMIDVVFLGYKEEYDVVDIIMKKINHQLEGYSID